MKQIQSTTGNTYYIYGDIDIVNDWLDSNPNKEEIENFLHTKLNNRHLDYGCALMNNILVVFDEDCDERVFKLLLKLNNASHKILLVAEHEGGVDILWKTKYPGGFRDYKEIEVAGDVWVLNHY